MILKALCTIFILLLNYFIYSKINKIKINRNHLTSLVIFLILIIVLNYIFKSISYKLIFFLLLFSFSLIALNFFKSFVNVYQRSDLLIKEKIEKVKLVMLNVMMPILITVYQILLIWVDKIFDKMIK